MLTPVTFYGLLPMDEEKKNQVFMKKDKKILTKKELVDDLKKGKYNKTKKGKNNTKTTIDKKSKTPNQKQKRTTRKNGEQKKSMIKKKGLTIEISKIDSEHDINDIINYCSASIIGYRKHNNLGLQFSVKINNM